MDRVSCASQRSGLCPPVWEQSLMVTTRLGVTLYLCPHHWPRWDISGLAVTRAASRAKCLYDLPNWKLTLKVEANVAVVTVLSFPDSYCRLNGFIILWEFKRQIPPCLSLTTGNICPAMAFVFLEYCTWPPGPMGYPCQVRMVLWQAGSALLAHLHGISKC